MTRASHEVRSPPLASRRAKTRKRRNLAPVEKGSREKRGKGEKKRRKRKGKEQERREETETHLPPPQSPQVGIIIRSKKLKARVSHPPPPPNKRCTTQVNRTENVDLHQPEEREKRMKRKTILDRQSRTKITHIYTNTDKRDSRSLLICYRVEVVFLKKLQTRPNE